MSATNTKLEQAQALCGKSQDAYERASIQTTSEARAERLEVALQHLQGACSLTSQSYGQLARAYTGLADTARVLASLVDLPADDPQRVKVLQPFNGSGQVMLGAITAQLMTILDGNDG